MSKYQHGYAVYRTVPRKSWIGTDVHNFLCKKIKFPIACALTAFHNQARQGQRKCEW